MTDEKRISSGAPLYEEEEAEGNILTRCCQQRYVLAGMGFWCFFVLSALRLNIGVAVVAMVNWTAVGEKNDSHGCHYSQVEERPQNEDGPFLWGPELQGYVLGSYFYGLSATQLLGGRLSEAVSAKLVLLTGTLLATVCTLLVPVAAQNDGLLVMLLQICKGLGQGILMPSFSVLMAKWIPPLERARFMSCIASGIPVGAFFTTMLSGYICKEPHLGWPYVFYIFGCVGGAWCVCWLWLIHDSPLKHPRITRRELNRIMSLRSQKAPQLSLSVPVRRILSSKPVWAYIVAGFASFWCLSLYVSVVPLFMGTILKFDIETNGTVSAIPNLVEAFCLICTSVLSDYMLQKKLMSATAIRKTAICTGLLGYAGCVVAVTFTGCQRHLSVFFMVMALGMSGFNFASTAVVPVDMSPRFAGTLSGIMNTFGALSGVLIPWIVGYLTRERQTIDEWSILFYLTAAICVFASLLFIQFGSSEVQPWNNPQAPESQEPAAPVAEEERRSRQDNPPTRPSTGGRPWRTDSFPEEKHPHSPAIVLHLP